MQNFESVDNLHLCPADEVFPEYDPGYKVLMQSVLKKRGRWSSAWQNRFFVLEASGRLSYFLKEDDKNYPQRARGIIPIDVRAVIESENEEGGSNDSISLIKIHVPGNGVTTGRTFVLCPRNQILYARWIEALSSVQQNVQYISFPSNCRHW